MPKGITQEYLDEKIYSRNDMGRFLKEFYDMVKHGDEEHQRWLRDEMLKFIHDKLIENE